MLIQKEYVSKRGLIKSVSFLHGSNPGRAIVGLYTGEDQPLSLVAQSNPISISKSGWTEVNLRSPYVVQTGQTIWLAFLLENNNQTFFYRDYFDGVGNRFEKRLWASSATWQNLGTNYQLPSNPPGNILPKLTGLFTNVYFLDSENSLICFADTGLLDEDDFFAWATRYSQNDLPFDSNEDNKINTLEFTHLLVNWQKNCISL